MSDPISSFQTELKNKIQYKASSKVSADMVLLKAFKFFDLYNHGYVNRKDFIRAIAKCGVIVDTYDLDKLYNYYDVDGNGKINYRGFVDGLLLKDNQSGGSENMSQIGMSEDKVVGRVHSRKIQQSNNMSEIFQQFTTHEDVIEHVKRQLRKNGIVGILKFAIQVKHTDNLRTHYISLEKLGSCLTFLNHNEIKLLTENLQPNPHREINYAQFIYGLKGHIPPNRQSIATDLFQALDHKREGQIQIVKLLGEFKDKYELTNFKEAVALYSQFQKIDDGIFTDEDFNDFFQFLSFSFTSDDQFSDFIVQGFYQSRSPKSSSSRSSRYREFQRKQISQLKSSKHSKQEDSLITGDFRKLKQEQQASEMQVKKFGNSQGNSQFSEKQSIASQRSEIKSVTTPQVKEVDMIIMRIKKRLGSKGSKGFLLFEKGLKGVDSNDDGFLNFEQFKTVIKQQKIDITTTESLTIFQIFNSEKRGQIDYLQLIQTIKGTMPRERQEICSRIWQRVREDPHYTTLHKIKSCLNFRNHPDVQTGRRYEEQIWDQIQQTIFLIQDLNQTKRSDQITKEVFEEYTGHLSLSIIESQLFESLAQNFWRVGSVVRVEDYYAGSRKMFDPTRKGYLQDHHRYAVNGGSVTDNAPFGTFKGPTVYSTEHQRL